MKNWLLCVPGMEVLELPAPSEHGTQVGEPEPCYSPPSSVCPQAQVAFLQGERKGQENLKTDLVRRIKMLEYALKQER